MKRNRAMCKLCESIIESHTAKDRVSCTCGEIEVDGGKENYICYAKDFKNFIRIDEEDVKIEVKVKEIDSTKANFNNSKEALEEMIKSIENMPSNALITSATQYDLLGILYLLQSFFSCKEES